MPGTDLFLLFRTNKKGKKPAVLKGLIHPTKGLLFDAADQDFSRFGNGHIIVKTPDGSGVYDPESGWALEPKFKHLRPMREDGLVPAAKTDNWGLMDASGTWVLEPEYRRLSFLSSDLLSLAKDELHYLADYTGTPVTEPRFMEIGPFYGGLAKARKPGGDVSDYFDDGHKWGLIDETGAWVVEPKFKHISRGSVLEAPLSACTGTREDYECGFIDKTGAWVVEPPVRAKGVYKDGTAIVEIDKSVGVVGLEGEWILLANYKNVSRQDGVFVVKTKDKQTLYFRYDGSPITLAPVN